MSGTQTHNYDLVMEFAENALEIMLEPLFGGKDGLLGELVEKVNLVLSGDQFFIDISFNRPSDINLNANTLNPVDIHINLGVGGTSGKIRIVVGLSVDHSNQYEDAIQLDFANNLYYVGIEDVPIIGTTRLPLVEDWLRTKAPLRLPGFNVDRATVDPMIPKQLEVTVIDDTSGEDRNAMAFCMTFGGGGGDTLSNFTKSFIPNSETSGAIAIFFGWLCRIMSPKIAESLGVTSNEFSDCTLHKSIDVGDGATLTKLQIQLDGEYIKVNAEVKKSGFCYSAKGKITGKVKLTVEVGQLNVISEMEDPDIDLDIPWYCYVAAAVIGFFGGLIFGIVGAIVGAILVPIITHIIIDVIGKLFQKIADIVCLKINSGLPNFSIPAYILNFVFQEVHIDDITIMFNLEVIDNTPIRCEGTATLYLGQGIDLDSGNVGDIDLPGLDLAWTGEGNTRAINTVCITQLSQTGSKSFFGQTHYSLYRLVFTPQVSVPVTELETITSHWWAPFGISEPTLWTYGVITNENRWAIVQAIQIENDYVVLRYRTYDTISPSVKIMNDLSFWFPHQAEPYPTQTYTPLYPPKNDDEREVVLVNALGKKVENLLNPMGMPINREAYSRCETLKGMIASRIRPDILQVDNVPTLANRGSINNRISISEAMQLAAPQACCVGEWSERRIYPNSDLMAYIAFSKNIKNPVKYYWYVNGSHLDQDIGQVISGQQTFNYTVSNNHVTLKATKMQETTFELKVKAVGVDGTDAETTRCLIFKPKYEQVVQTIPTYQNFQRAYETNFGIVTGAKVHAAHVLPSI